VTRPTPPNRFPEGLEAPPPLEESVRNELAREGIDVALGAQVRAEHSRDWWPRLIPGVAAGRVGNWPGAVVSATSTHDVSATLRIASSHRIAVTPQGGRSGVVGGAIPEGDAIALDLTGLNRVLEIDDVSGTVRVEAGVFGPDLEAALAPYGLTAGHFPQSFDLATVGGWIASRGAGQYSNRYGTIEDLVRGLTVVLASGDIVHLGGHGPREAVGPDLTRLFVGSEGTLGVITEATLVVRRRAPYERRRAYSFTSFGEGLNACREMLQRGARPAVLRLYDEVESARHFELNECALVVLEEGDPVLVDATITIVEEECRDAHVRDEALVERWLERRNDVSALAPLWERGLVLDTIEVAGSWSILASLHERVTRTLRSLEGMLVVSVHQSHAYLDGACLYFTFAAQPANPEVFYRRAWDVAMAEVMSAGGAVSHHHGVGRNRARFVARALGDGLPLLEGVKALLDPLGIMNPGVLALGAAPW
jgi:alkyldihydroxyacetonephosphate synthase